MAPSISEPFPRPYETFLGRIRQYLGLGSTSSKGDDILSRAEIAEPSESSLLLPNAQPSLQHGHTSPSDISTTREGALAAGEIQTTWQREAKVITKYSLPLAVTYLLQFSLTLVSVFTVGHIGKVELGAASLATMTANITGYILYFGLATSLDTLSAQAYGSGRKELVGIQLQRMVYLLWIVTIPIGIIWWNSEFLLQRILPDPELARLAGLYLKVILCGAPAVAAFEGGKRFVQAQGLFNASLVVLLIGAPLNAFLHWFFVWRLGLGFIGTPIAVTVTDNLLPLFLFLYVYFIDGRECWPGFTYRAFKNWGPMIRLAIPGLVMTEAEYIAFEILTLAASYLSTGHLAAQAVLANTCAFSYQISFSLSIAGSTRVANLIGANRPAAAKTSTRVVISAACVVGSINLLLFSTLRTVVPTLFTHDADVAHLVTQTLPICAAVQLYDALATTLSGILRGLGKQYIGGWVNLICYWVVALPVSIFTAFWLDWKLNGLWTGVGATLALVSVIQGWFVYRTDWDRAVEEADKRNISG